VVTCEPPVVTAISSNEFQTNPAFIGPNATTQLAVVTNAPDGSSFRFVGPDPVPQVLSSSPLGPGAFVLEVETGDIAQGDSWTLEVCLPGEPLCCGILQDQLVRPVCLVFTTSTPSQAGVNTGTRDVTFIGFGFETQELTLVQLFDPNDPISNLVTGFEVLSEDTFRATIDTDGANVASYTLRLSPSFQRIQEGCPGNVEFPNAFEITP